jgi:hypothetical protein
MLKGTRRSEILAPIGVVFVGNQTILPSLLPQFHAGKWKTRSMAIVNGLRDHRLGEKNDSTEKSHASCRASKTRGGKVHQRIVISPPETAQKFRCLPNCTDTTQSSSEHLFRAREGTYAGPIGKSVLATDPVRFVYQMRPMI